MHCLALVNHNLLRQICLLWLFQIKHVFIQEQLKWFWNFASLVKAFFSWNILYTKWTAATSLEAAGCFFWKRFWSVGGSSSWNDSKADKGWMRSVTSVVEQDIGEAAQWLVYYTDLKFIYSEKATKFCKIFTLLLTGTT